MGKTPATAWKIAIASAWGVVLLAAFATTTPRPWMLTLIGMGLGCLVGLVRWRAIAAGNTARIANALAWLGGIGLLVLAMAIAEDMFIGAWAASLAGFLFVDRACSLLAGYRKQQVPPGVVGRP